MPKAKGTAETISIVELLKMFPNDESVVEWLEETRWENKPTCAHCGGTEKISNAPAKKYGYWCGNCRDHFNVMTGTVMHGTRTPLQNWMVAIYYVMTARKGISAMQLSKEISVQYKTAWYMLHRIREASGDSDAVLSGIVEMDEVFVGGREGAKHKSKKLNAGRGPVGKTPVMGIRERGGKTVAKPVDSANMKTANEFASDKVEEGSTVYTDDSVIYGKLPFAHDFVNHSAGQYVKGDCHTNGMESVWAVFKRSLHGTWHHVSVKHLPRYVNEATMRLNGGNVRRDTINRMEDLARNMKGRRIRYKELVANG